MGKSLLLCFALLSTTLSAATIEEAGDLFLKRAENAKNAELAATMFKELAASASSPVAKALLKTREAQAIYYVGSIKTTDAEKKDAHKRGMEASLEASALIDPTTASKTEKALAHYFYVINLGKWAEANGVLSSLGKWGEMKDQLDTIDSLDSSVDDYGPLRTRARALHKLPFGDKNESEKLLALAVEKTFSEKFNQSTNTTNSVYYLDILAKNRNTDKFCELFNSLNDLSAASDEELLELNPNKLPETKSDLKKFKENKGFEEDVKKFADRNC